MKGEAEIKSQTRIDADLLIPGRGQPTQNATCVFSASGIVYAGATAQLPDALSKLPVATKVPTLLPGLWDAHVHYYGAQRLSIDAFYHTHAALAGARCAHDFKVTLDAGFTSVRELGGWGHEISPAVAEGSIPGPTVYSAIVPITTTGGHGDAHGVALPALKTAIEHTGLPLYLCDGVPECLTAVRTQLRKGAKLIKVCASGGCSSQHDDPEDVQFSDEELAAMVGEAGRSQRSVAAHCHGRASIMAALRAGATTIEHGTYLDEEALALLKEKGATLVMTRNFFAGGLQVRELWGKESWAKLNYAAATHKKAYEMAVKAGAKIALGTDLGLGGVVKDNPAAKVFSHGSNGREIVYAVEAGMTPLQAIEACTVNAAETLGKMAPKSGQLRQDWDADLIAVQGNPLEDIKLLAEPAKISHVWQFGQLKKGSI